MLPKHANFSLSPEPHRKTPSRSTSKTSPRKISTSRMHRQPYQRAQHHPYKVPFCTSTGHRSSAHPKPYFRPFRRDFPFGAPPPTQPKSTPIHNAQPVFDDNAPPTERLPLEGYPSINTLHKHPQFIKKHQFPSPPPTYWQKQPPTPFPFTRPKSPNKLGPKHLNLDPAAVRPIFRDAEPAIGPLRAKAQARDNQHRKVRMSPEERARVTARKDLSKMEKKINETMCHGPMNAEDDIFLKQIKALRIDHVYRNELSKHRDVMLRAADLDEERVQELSSRDEKAKQLKETEADEKRREKERIVEARIAEEKRREEERIAEERRREEERLAAEEARRAEEERRETLRRLREDIERCRREAEERAERYRKAMEEEARNEAIRQAELRKAREAAQAAMQKKNDDAILQQFILYDAKWAELKSDVPHHSIMAAQLPWPILVSNNVPVHAITYNLVQEFVFHPLRPGLDGKTRRDKVKMEMLRYHPDKFNSRILDKVLDSERGLVMELGGSVARILTQMMAEEVEMEK